MLTDFDEQIFCFSKPDDILLNMKYYNITHRQSLIVAEDNRTFKTISKHDK